MTKIIPKVFGHGSYIGTTGYCNHTRSFFRELSKSFKVKYRNFTVGKGWNGYKDEPHNDEDYLDNLDKKLLDSQYMWNDGELFYKNIYSNYSNEFIHNVNIVLCETHHHVFYQNYRGPKIAYNVWESTKQPEEFFNKLKEFDQIWVASKWQRDCTIEQGMDPLKVKVVPEAVDGTIFKPNSKATLPEYKDNRFKFVLFGRWDFRKSTKEIIESFLKEFNKNEPVDLIVSIDNPFANDGYKTTEERLKHYKLDDPRIKIKHFPSRKDYIQYLQKGHVFLSCARSEGWNLPLIEAMACGTPSIYSNCSAQLEFAKNKGLPVKIKNKIPAKQGEYSSYSQSDLPGEIYEPDFSDLKKVMRDAYQNYNKHKNQALIDSKLIRKKFTWKNAAKIATKEINNLMNNLSPNKLEVSFQNGPKVEVKGLINKEYKVEFVNQITNITEHSATIKNNMWTKCNKEYYVPWIIKIDDVVVHKFDLKDKTVKITFDTNSIGDNLAFIPQVLEFQKKYKCKVVVSTFYNDWFKNLPVYNSLEFIEPNTHTKCYAQYTLGAFQNEGKWDKGNKNPNQSNTIPLIQIATDILGLPYKEIKHNIDFIPKSRPIKGKYICIGPESTAGLKEWPHSSWKTLSKKLHKDGYKVVSLTTKKFQGINIINKLNLSFPDLFNYLHHADIFIGLGSGLSWINHNLNKHTIMINGFLPYGFEFTKNLTKIDNGICKCWTDINNHFDKGDWDWCPEYQGTKYQHICMKSITVDQVYNTIINHLNEK